MFRKFTKGRKNIYNDPDSVIIDEKMFNKPINSRYKVERMVDLNEMKKTRSKFHTPKNITFQSTIEEIITELVEEFNGKYTKKEIRYVIMSQWLFIHDFTIGMDVPNLTYEQINNFPAIKVPMFGKFVLIKGRARYLKKYFKERGENKVNDTEVN